MQRHHAREISPVVCRMRLLIRWTTVTSYSSEWDVARSLFAGSDRDGADLYSRLEIEWSIDGGEEEKLEDLSEVLRY